MSNEINFIKNFDAKIDTISSTGLKRLKEEPQTKENLQLNFGGEDKYS